MKTHTITTHSLAELSKEAAERAFRDYREMQSGMRDVPWQDEIRESVQAVFARAGVKLRDWQIDPFGRSHLVARFDREETDDLRGRRAFAWLENNLFSSLRVPFGPISARRKSTIYGRDYRPGMVKPCPLTGYCFDDEILGHLCKSVRSGDSLREAFESVAKLWADALAAEIEYLESEEAFRQWAYDAEFLKDGQLYRG